MSGDLIFAEPEDAPRGPRLPSWSVMFNITRNPAAGTHACTCNVLPSHGDRRALNVGSESEAYEVMASWLEQSARQIRDALELGRLQLLHP